ncbi:ABC transporter substrate-binding protein [Ferrovibrio sp.]|uniref:ABC transporter substrate-binding protein n=1 Tax=Ferrovibrio sp. TaxID=1917215 RepID=UPI0035B024BB
MNAFSHLARMLSGMALLLGVSVASAQAQPIKIGIAQWGPHPQLEKAVSSFKAELTRLGLVEGKDVVYEIDQANFDVALLPQLLNKLKATKPAMIYTIATPVTQAAKQALKGSGIPIVYAAVNNPVKASLVPSWTEGAEDMAGASDQQDMDAVQAFARKLLPNAKRIAVAYNPGEDNNLAVFEQVKATAGKYGFSVVGAGIDNPADIPIRIAALKGQADLVYTPTGGLIQPGLPAIAASAGQIGIPVLNAGIEAAKQGIVLAGYAVDYGKVGANAANVAYKILKQGAKMKDLPPVRASAADHEAAISGKQLAKLNLKLPAELADCKCVTE